MKTAYATELVNQMKKLGEPGSEELNNRLYPLVAAGDPDARREMIESNMSLVVNKVDSYIRCFPGVAHLSDDLLSEGFVGLTDAVNKMAEAGPIENPNPTGYMSQLIHFSLGKAVDMEAANGASRATLNRKRQLGEELPQQVSEPMDRPDEWVDPTSMTDLRDLIDACCESDEDRAIIRMREEGLADRAIAAALNLPYATTYMMRREIYRRFLEKSGMKGEV